MNGLMERYRESLAQTPGPVLLKDCPQVRMDLKGMMAFAKAKGVQPCQLDEAEKARFIDATSTTTVK